MNKRNRPKIELRSNKKWLFVEAITLLLVIAYFLNLMFVWKGIPDTIPIHFNINGEVNGVGSKNWMIYLGVIDIIIYLILTWVGRYPHLANFPVKITESNAEKQYILLRIFLKLIKLELSFYFLYIQFLMIMSIFAVQGLLRMHDFINMVIILIITLGVYIFNSFKNS